MAADHRADSYMFSVALVFGLLAAIPAAVESIGVGYGVNGNDLPSASEVVQLYKSTGITSMRIYTVDGNTLQAVSGSNIGLILDTGNTELANLAANASSADSWVKTNVQSHQGLSIKYIAVGNEVPGQGGDPRDILPAMKNVQAALDKAGVSGIKVSTAVNSAVTAGFPPSHGIFQCLLRLPHAAHRAVPGHHRRAAARQHLPLLLLQGRHHQHPPRLRPLHRAGHGGHGRQRQPVPEPVRRPGGHHVLRARERRRHERPHRGVGERLAVGGRRHGRDPGQRTDVQPEPDQPCREGDTQEAWGH